MGAALTKSIRDLVRSNLQRSCSETAASAVSVRGAVKEIMSPARAARSAASAAAVVPPLPLEHLPPPLPPHHQQHHQQQEQHHQQLPTAMSRPTDAELLSIFPPSLSFAQPPKGLGPLEGLVKTVPLSPSHGSPVPLRFGGGEWEGEGTAPLTSVSTSHFGEASSITASSSSSSSGVDGGGLLPLSQRAQMVTLARDVLNESYLAAGARQKQQQQQQQQQGAAHGDAPPAEHTCSECSKRATRRCHECSEDLCEPCFKRLHAGGKRVDHLWTPYAQPTTVSTKFSLWPRDPAAGGGGGAAAPHPAVHGAEWQQQHQQQPPLPAWLESTMEMRLSPRREEAQQAQGAVGSSMSGRHKLTANVGSSIGGSALRRAWGGAPTHSQQQQQLAAAAAPSPLEALLSLEPQSTGGGAGKAPAPPKTTWEQRQVTARENFLRRQQKAK